MLDTRLQELATLRANWRPPGDEAALALRRAYAAWANAGIEGNPIPWPEARRLLAGIAEGRPLGRSELELLGCLAAQRFAEGPSLDWTPAFVRHLHALLMEGLGRDPGGYRHCVVCIVKESGPGAGEPVFDPPHPARVPELMEALLADLVRARAAREDSFLISGRFHYEFQSIHPFEDGNGRLGRILSTAIAREGWDSAGFDLAPAVARAGRAYYLALRAVRPDYGSEAGGRLDGWLAAFLDIAADALRHPDPPADAGKAGSPADPEESDDA